MKIKNYIKDNYFRILPEYLNFKNKNKVVSHKGAEFPEWINAELVKYVEEFFNKYKLADSFFIRRTNRIFKTDRFNVLTKRWLVDYLFILFNRLYDYENERMNQGQAFILEDNSLHRFAVEKYSLRFGNMVKIHWVPQTNLLQRIISVFIQQAFIVYHSLKTGLILLRKKNEYKVMREALWGLSNVGGYFFHDDFMVDGDKIRKEDLLLFSRWTMKHDTSRLKAHEDAKKSGYAHFFLPSLPLGMKQFFCRIIPLYVVREGNILLNQVRSGNFSLYQSIFYYFFICALPYEKIFSNYKVSCELGHNYFTADHIPEAIVCQNYSARHYLLHWSDNSINIDRHILSYLGCDRFLLWGKAHLQGVEGDPNIFEFTGYFFKGFIKWVVQNRDKVISDIGIKRKGKIISFFDESFGGTCKMSEAHFISFWGTALKYANAHQENTVIMKPKELFRYNSLSGRLKNKFLEIKSQLEGLGNVYILDSQKWSFIEAIGISDIVVTQGMTSSGTIALICGIEALYLDEANYRHPFSIFKEEIVFNDSDRLINRIDKIISGEESSLSKISYDMMRGFDAFDNDRGLDYLRQILVGN